MKIASVVGTRPQFIKLAPIACALEEYQKSNPKQKICHLIVHTGQHYSYEMDRIFFEELDLPEVDYNLEVRSNTQGWQTGEMMKRIERVLIENQPDWVLVYGDTNSTLAGALAAIKLHIPVAHVESGLRSYNKRMPEEINRLVTDHVSSLLFCPSQTAVKNLQKEGFRHVLNRGKLIDTYLELRQEKDRFFNPLVINAGDVMLDVFQREIKTAEVRSQILEQLKVEDGKYCLLTLHRAETTESVKSLEERVSFAEKVAASRTLIFPMHPRLKKFYGEIKKKFSHKLRIIEPVSYLDSLILIKNSALVLTDSGGIQKEAFWLRVPCLTLRDETEWVETVKSGWNILYKNYRGSHKPQPADKLFYGDGKAANRILDVLLQASS